MGFIEIAPPDMPLRVIVNVEHLESISIQPSADDDGNVIGTAVVITTPTNGNMGLQFSDQVTAHDFYVSLKEKIQAVTGDVEYDPDVAQWVDNAQRPKQRPERPAVYVIQCLNPSCDKSFQVQGVTGNSFSCPGCGQQNTLTDAITMSQQPGEA